MGFKTDYSDIKKYLRPELDRVDALMSDLLASDISLLNRTNDSVLFNSGKKIRPVLAILVAKACNDGKYSEDTIIFAAAAELLHNATLLHDDVADNSPSRRGKPTIMAIMGRSASVLLGDYWLVKAMEAILSSESRSDYIIRVFSKTLSDLAEGEMLQLQKATKCDTTADDYMRIIYNKTASLFVSTSLSAAVSVKAGEVEKNAIIRFATHLGCAFQMKDDILDYAGGEKTGKPGGQDLMEQKITLPLFCAFKNAGREKENRIRRKISNITDNPGYQREVVNFVLENGGVEDAGKVLNCHVHLAISDLDVLRDGRDKDYLVSLAEFVAERQR